MKVLASGEDWETVDDDGFVYKRAKRDERDEGEEEDDDEEGEEDGSLSPQETLEQRREDLLKRKEMYSTELRMWEELLSRQEEINAAAVPPPLIPSAMADSPAIMLGEPHYEPYEQLLQQVQDLEFFIRKYTSVCERAEDMLRILEDKIRNHTLQNLQSPREIFFFKKI